MSAAKKATIYVDVDDEITTLIDKMNQAKEKIVALVLPKRATMLQSIVNMKLLKRSGDEANKKIVLITSESSILPLAGAVGVHVAKTLQSKPEVPSSPIEHDEKPEAAEVEDVEIDKAAPVGALAGIASNDEEETAEIPEEPTDKASGDKTAKKAAGSKKAKKFKIPNFNKFRLKLALAVVAILLLVGGWAMATMVLPSAEIVVKTDTRTFSKSLTATGSPEISAVDTENQIVPIQTEELQKSDSETVQASGEKNIGKKADGTLTLTNCIDDGEDQTVPAGTSFTKDGKTFVTTKSVKLQRAVFFGDDECATGSINGYGGKKDVDVVATDAGASYNIDEGSFASSMAGIDAYGSDMEGGTDQIVKVVSQQDIDSAVEALKAKTSEGTVDDLKALLRGQSYVPLESSYKASDPQTEASKEAGAEAESVTVTSTNTYSMTGVLEDGLDALVREASKEDIDEELQGISDTGLDAATIRVTEERPDGTMALSIETSVVAGPQLNPDNLKQEILGKKRGETQSTLESKAGVSEVQIEYSPFWVGATPKNANKVQLTVENPSEEADSTSAQDNVDQQ